jgi:hypothetical protein
VNQRQRLQPKGACTMRKIRLDVDGLKVESFATDGYKRSVGTVHALSGFGSGCGPCDTDKCPAPPPTEYPNASCGYTLCDPTDCMSDCPTCYGV